MSAFGPAADKDRHLTAPRMSMLVLETQVAQIEADAVAGGMHVHRGRDGEETPVPVDAAPGEAWVTVCSGS